MKFPRYDEVQPIILKELVNMGGKGTTNEIYERVAKHFPYLTKADTEERYKTGDKKWSAYVRSAKSVLVKNGDVVSSGRGKWKITNKGRDRIAK